MVQLELTIQLIQALELIRPALPSELADQVDQLVLSSPRSSIARSSDPTPSSASSVPHSVLVQVSKWARTGRQSDAGSYTLAALLRLTHPHIRPLAPRERSPALLAILAKLQLAQDRADYAAMTSLNGPQRTSLLPMRDIHDPALTGLPERTVAEEWLEVRRELSAVANVLASMGAVGTAVWWVGGGRSYAARLMLSMAGALAIAAIEAFLYWRFFTRESREEPRKRSRGAKVLAFDHMPVALAAKRES